MSRANDVIHQQTRLRIMATLNALPKGEMLEFMRLKAIMKVTDGNLGAHLTTVENAAYIAVTKDFADKKPRTRMAMTRAGREAFAQHVGYLCDILDSAR